MMYIFLLFLFVILILAGLPWKIDLTRIQLKTEKIRNPVRIMVLADLHCRPFGRGQKKILDALEREKPDLIIIPGDLFDYERDYEISFELIRGLKGYPVYFTSGNHDVFLADEIGQLRQRLRSEGVIVLENSSAVFHEMEIAGLTDMGPEPSKTPVQVSALFRTDLYRILISHRPAYTELYRACRCDLIISGHNHGGQWHLPFTKIGVYTPHGGLFPAYTGGTYDMNGSVMFISRGLASGHPKIPRLYNNPEIGIIDVIPDSEENKKL